jgi:hypothetical protein
MRWLTAADAPVTLVSSMLVSAVNRSEVSGVMR